MSCLSNLQNSATLSRASERACFFLREASLSRSKESYHPHKENLVRHNVPKLGVAGLDLEATRLKTEPDLQAGPGLKLEPNSTRAELDLEPDLLDPGLGPEILGAEPG